MTQYKMVELVPCNSLAGQPLHPSFRVEGLASQTSRATESFPLQLELAVCSNIKTRFVSILHCFAYKRRSSKFPELATRFPKFTLLPYFTYYNQLKLLLLTDVPYPTRVDSGRSGCETLFTS